MAVPKQRRSLPFIRKRRQSQTITLNTFNYLCPQCKKIHDRRIIKTCIK